MCDISISVEYILDYFLNFWILDFVLLLMGHDDILKKMDKFIEEFEEVSTDAARVQRVTLKRILEDNALAEYLQNLGLNGRTDPESFKLCVPLVTHKDLEPVSTELLMFPMMKNGKALHFIYGSKQFKTRGGLVATTITGELPLVTSIYGASEGFIAANVNPKLPPEFATYAVFPQNGYFEFIPLTQLNNDGTFLCADPQPMGLTEVKVGKEYEIVVTNSAGLYRYRLGDVVKVMGFHNSTPKLKFIRRSSILRSINIDKNTEKDLQLAVEASSKLLAEEKLEVVEFTSHVDLSKEPGHYVIFWEINGEASEQVLIILNVATVWISLSSMQDTLVLVNSTLSGP
ncbi:putative GH3 family protein [Medicago truncatula]|uniref:Putative GH3 family protein n=1 Tax=Medicago truncatula TaxID=3880 RepID=A0A396JRF9_MEDTR|nr:putative GH3 family protein [Medicago truncatula]